VIDCTLAIAIVHNNNCTSDFRVIFVHQRARAQLEREKGGIAFAIREAGKERRKKYILSGIGNRRIGESARSVLSCRRERVAKIYARVIMRARDKPVRVCERSCINAHFGARRQQK